METRSYKTKVAACDSQGVFLGLGFLTLRGAPSRDRRFSKGRVFSVAYFREEQTDNTTHSVYSVEQELLVDFFFYKPK